MLSHGATSKVQVRPDVSVATGSSAADDSVSGDIASYLSCGATTTDCIKLKLIESRIPAANVPMPSRQYTDKSHTCGVTQ